MNRKKFIGLSFAGGVGMFFRRYDFIDKGASPFVMTVNGKLSREKVKAVLPHEHITTDFTGAEKVVQPQYKPMDAFNIILPFLINAKQRGISLITECTPNYIGRDVQLLQMLSKRSGVDIMTNTGYYAAVGQKYLPRHAFVESDEQLATRFLQEWENGIAGTDIKPGFIKLGVDKGPLKAVEKKLIKAGAKTHLRSGLTIAIHTGDAAAAEEELSVLSGEGVAPDAFIWVHAQNDQSGDTQVAMAKKGCWISLDGINATDVSIEKYSNFLLRFKENNLLNRVLISHDDGWAVNKNAGDDKVTFKLFENGNTMPYQAIFTHLKPNLLQRGFTENDFTTIMVTNPGLAYSIKVRRV